jgi:hypothetical protein
LTVQREPVSLKFDTLKKDFLNIISVLLGMNDIPAVSSNEFGDSSYDATLVWARK